MENQNNKIYKERLELFKNDRELFLQNSKAQNNSKLIEQICRIINENDYYRIKAFLITTDGFKRPLEPNPNEHRHYSTLIKHIARLNSTMDKLNSDKKRK